MSFMLFWFYNLRFILSTLFTAHKEKIISTLGRIVIITWLFVVFIINNSYTANLSSLLTAEKLSSHLVLSEQDNNLRIGYQKGSFVRNYLIDEFQIDEKWLVPLNSPEEIDKAFADGPLNGGIATYVDERPYMDIFLSKRCHLTITNEEFISVGWGFAFQRDSPLTIDISTAILELSEIGELQRIQDKWLASKACNTMGAKLRTDRLRLGGFLGLFIVCGASCLLAVVIHFLYLIRQFRHYYSATSSRSRVSWFGVLHKFILFVDQKQVVKTRRKRRRVMQGLSNADE
ncbi:hypothetical protein QQ045_020615 [Rhodiola kirilowii]